MKSSKSLIQHLTRHVKPLKECSYCRRDVASEWRTKNADGDYMCGPCSHTLNQSALIQRLGFHGEAGPGSALPLADEFERR